MTRDMTEREEAEQALRESEARHRAVIEQTADAIFLIASLVPDRWPPREPATVQHEPLVQSEGVFELPVPGNPHRSPDTPYARCFGRVC